MLGKSSVIDSLKTIFADTYALYLKTQNYHWNVTGQNFSAFHGMFESQYRELAEALDELAERLRILGVKAPGSFEEIQALLSIGSGSPDPTPEEMVTDLLDGHMSLARAALELMRAASGAGDEGTVGLLSERLSSHEKTAWMLRSSLSK